MKNKKPLALAVTTMLLLSGCGLIPKMPETAKPLAAAQAGLQDGTRTAMPAERWWTEFKDPQLDALVERALAESPSLAAARSRVARAAAAAEAAGAADKPTIGAGFDASRQRFSEHGLYPPPIAGSWRTTGTLQAGISYDWDFFGRNKAELAAALGTKQAAEADAAAARLMLSAQTARAYLALARVTAQRELLDQQLAEREQALGLVRERVAAGLDNRQDQRTAEQPLPELRRQRVQLEEQAAVARHQLAALTAQPGDALKSLSPKLPSALALASDTPLGMDLLGRRPDVVAARWRAEAATQKISSARAQFYPSVNLSAFAGFNAIGLDNLLNAGSRMASFGPSLRLPLFDTGRLRAQLHGAAADAEGAVATYNNTLLEAVRDTADQLSGLQSLQGQAREQQAALANAEASVQLIESRVNAGMGNRLAVLNARQSLITQQRAALDLRAQALDSQVRLVHALGGGWHE